MLTCIACSKQLSNTDGTSFHEPREDDINVSTPSNKQAIRALTAQIKGMAVKASDAYKHCNPCSGSLKNNRRLVFMDSDVGTMSERFYGSYRRTGSSNSSTPRLWGREVEAKLNVHLSGASTPASVSSRTESVVFLEEDEPKEWVAQVEPGVLITFVSLPHAGNHLKRIRFGREIFDKQLAQRWWAENYDRVMELYNVQRFNHHAVPLPTPLRSEDENSKLDSAEDCPMTPPLSKEHPPHHFHPPISHLSLESPVPLPVQSHCDLGGVNSTLKLSSISASARSSSSREIDHSGELSVSNGSDLETEWVEEDEPGVYITIRTLPGGARELRRVRFSRERFGEMHARLWWEENRGRIQKQYL